MRRNGARTCIFMIISKVSSGVVWSILSNVNPALFTMWLIFPHLLYNGSYVGPGKPWVWNAYWTVASTIFFGKSSAPTSPATERHSPPWALISPSTVSRRLASILLRCSKLNMISGVYENGRHALADDNLGPFFREEESCCTTDALHRYLIKHRLEQVKGRIYLAGTWDHRKQFVSMYS